LNPLFFGVQVLAHAFVAPSFALLRGTAVASGLLALASITSSAQGLRSASGGYLDDDSRRAADQHRL